MVNERILNITSVASIYFTLILFGSVVFPSIAKGQEQVVRIVWDKSPIAGSIEVVNDIGQLVELSIMRAAGKVKGRNFSFYNKGRNELTLRLEVDSSILQSPLIQVVTEDYGFSFFLKDVNSEYPIYIPHYSVVVLNGNDNRGYEEISEEITLKNRKLKLDIIDSLPEVTYLNAKESSNLQFSPTWIGLGRDIRMFEIEESVRAKPRQKTLIYPQFISRKTNLKLMNNLQSVYSYTLGRGHGVKSISERKLYEGYMPILENHWQDDDIHYTTLSFSSLPLSSSGKLLNVDGVDFTVSDAFSNGYQYSPGYSKEKELDAQLNFEKHKNNSGSIILCIKGVAINNGDVPRYVWYKTLYPGYNWSSSKAYKYSFDEENGFSYYDSSNVFAVSKIDGLPIPYEENAILLNPGEKINFEFYLPHEPVNWNLAKEIKNWDIEDLFKRTLDYWRNKESSAGKISVPERRINEMLKAGLLHLELMTFGNEPEGSLAANAGRFLPIGTESSPIIQYYCSIGKFDIARRCIEYFLEKQRNDGALRNYQGYSVETGAVLWTIGEYIRYTNDLDWLNTNKERLLAACEFLISWRQSDDGGNDYKLISGKVADPDNSTSQFMLNGYGYLGLSRMGEVLELISPNDAKRIISEAKSWKEDIRKAFQESLTKSPVIPLGDGRWSPTSAPWVEALGPQALYVNKNKVFSHGTFTGLDAMLGPLYLVFCEVIDPEEWYSTMLLEYNSELFLQENVTFSQPYYSRHNWLQMKRGMAKPFINTYYNTMAGMSDPDTYTFSEHTYENSIYKEHEEAWFLMQTRWMLYVEEGETLSLLKTIPRDWMGDGKEIILENVKSYFGPINLNIKSHVIDGYIEAYIDCNETIRKPKSIHLRIPHPENKAPQNVIGGKYDYKTETIVISDFTGEKSVRIEY